MEIEKRVPRGKIAGNANRKKQKLYKIIFFLVLIWFIGSGVAKLTIGLFIDTEIVRAGVIENSHPLKGYLLRDEIVINAPVTGEVKDKVLPGERVSKGKDLFQVETVTGSGLDSKKTVNITAPKAGVVSYVIDGMEQFFQPNMLQELDINKIEQLTPKYIDNSSLDMVEKGNKFCKIVNNLEGIQLYFEFPIDLFENPLQKGQLLNLNFPQLSKEIYTPIVDLKGFGNTAQVLVNLPDMWYSLINIRTVDIELVLDRQQGILAPKKALVQKETGEVGVFWLRKGFVFWQDIEVIAEKENEVVIKGIEPLTEIILTPNLVKEGQHIGGGLFGYIR